MVGGGGGGGGGSSTPDYGHGNGGAGYTPTPAASPYAPQYAQQNVSQPITQFTPQTATPFLQSIMAKHSGQMPQGNSLGLPSLQSMFGMQQRSSPLQGGLRQLAPMAPYVGSTYRPNMAALNQNLNNVAPSVALQQKQAAEAQAKWDAEHPAMPSYGGGSDAGGD
jgi:hypothetical protein